MPSRIPRPPAILLALLALSTAFAAPRHPNPCESAPNELKVTIYSDFECPFYAKFAPASAELLSMDIEGVKPKVEFRHFPLEFHRNAELAHRAAAAAALQNKFWPMHDLIFANQRSLDRQSLLNYARQLRLDEAKFQTDLDSPQTRQLIGAHKSEGVRLGVNGTPTFFVNGRTFSGTRTAPELRQLLTGELQRGKALCSTPDDSLAKGPANATIRIELFADLQSPLTQAAASALDELVTLYPTSVRVQFRNFPMAFRESSPWVHQAAMAAAAQGRFWHMANYLVDHAGSVQREEVVAFAGRLGLDAQRLAADLDSRAHKARIDLDLADGAARGVRAAPTVVLNGKRLDGIPPVRLLIDAVTAELAAIKLADKPKP